MQKFFFFKLEIILFVLFNFIKSVFHRARMGFIILHLIVHLVIKIALLVIKECRIIVFLVQVQRFYRILRYLKKKKYLKINFFLVIFQSN